MAVAEVMGVLRCKPGTAFAVIAPGGFRLLAALDAVAQAVGADLTITAGTNGHASGRHCEGEAFDVSVVGLSPGSIATIHAALAQRLGPAFAVLYEVPVAPADPRLARLAFVNPAASGQHLHLQVKKGTVWPGV